MPPSPAVHPANLISASRYRNATTSPSAMCAFVLCAITSIASRVQRLVTIAKRPSQGHGTRGGMPVICPTSQAKWPATRWRDGQITRATQNPVKRKAIACSRVPDAARHEMTRRRSGTYATRMIFLAPDQQRTANALRSIRGAPRDDPHPGREWMQRAWAREGADVAASSRVPDAARHEMTRRRSGTYATRMIFFGPRISSAPQTRCAASGERRAKADTPSFRDASGCSGHGRATGRL